MKGEYYARVIDVIDGDTFISVIKYNDKYYKIRCKLSDFDSPEAHVNYQQFLMYKNKLKGMIHGNIIKIDCYEIDRYNRIHVIAHLLDNPISINNLMNK
jgi:hypothetical protein